jgi:hypothetical protein
MLLTDAHMRAWLKRRVSRVRLLIRQRLFAYFLKITGKIEAHASKSATNDLLSIPRCKGTDYDLSPSSSQTAPHAIRVHIWVSLRRLMLLRKSRA